MRKRDLFSAAAGALAATALAGGIAFGAIPGDGGVIQSCYDSGGNLKVVSALPCPRGYTPLAWNQTGLQGPQGIHGPQGAQGPKGDQGEQGDPGNLALAGRSCPSGSFLTGFDSSGELVCAAPGDGGGGGGGGGCGGSEPGDVLVTSGNFVFPPTLVGTESITGFFSLNNGGSADAAVTITLAGENPTDFRVPSSVLVPACGGQMYVFLFEPTGVGLRTATMTFHLPNGESVTIELSGTGE